MELNQLADSLMQNHSSLVYQVGEIGQHKILSINFVSDSIRYSNYPEMFKEWWDKVINEINVHKTECNCYWTIATNIESGVIFVQE